MDNCVSQKAEFITQQLIRNKNRVALQKMGDTKRTAGEGMERGEV